MAIERSKAVALSIEDVMQSKKPNNVTEFLEAFRTPVETVGRALHTEFSGINYRGIRTHDVGVRRIDTDPYLDSTQDSIASRKNQIIIITKFQLNEIENVGQTFKLFLNELELSYQDIQDGFIRLEDVQEEIPKSKCYFSIGIRVTPEALKQGKSGFIVSSSGEIEIFPRIKQEFNEKKYRSKLEEKNSNLLLELRNVSINRIKHPLVERLLAEGAFLIGKAIADRKIKSDVF